ncbi:hypothetical protein [Lapidilactobacillus gannanensis]|uniref:Uncharacterized protein n=1 Tax=Lapidilactobacillus gannanensis TaxID=2486002 RepID=A0ABW4BM90_9LACO|nr:hypothetical protein [Lapidilactobacillus gannanensis]
MNGKEFFDYFESVTTAKDSFLDKALELQTSKNLKRAPAKRYNETIVAQQADKLWAELVGNLYNNIKNQLKNSDKKSAWTELLDNDDVVEQLDDSIAEINLNETQN